jgi:hypothetical protein
LELRRTIQYKECVVDIKRLMDRFAALSFMSLMLYNPNIATDGNKGTLGCFLEALVTDRHSDPLRLQGRYDFGCRRNDEG